MKTCDVTIVVCTYNRAAMLEQALASLVELETESRFTYEVLVVDNNSSDATPETIAAIVAKNGGLVRGVHESRRGISAARNRGVAEARGRWIAFFDDDQLADRRWLCELMKTAEAFEVWSVGGAVHLNLPPGTPQLPPVCRMLLGESVGMSEPLEYTRKITPGAGNWMLHRQVFETLGRFNESLPRGEDTEFFRRMLRQGFVSRYTPAAIVYHQIPPDRLTRRTLWTIGERLGAAMAGRALEDWGKGRFVFVWLMRLFQACLYAARHAVLALMGNRGFHLLGAHCRLALGWGYAHGGLQALLSPPRAARTDPGAALPESGEQRELSPPHMTAKERSVAFTVKRTGRTPLFALAGIGLAALLMLGLFLLARSSTANDSARTRAGKETAAAMNRINDLQPQTSDERYAVKLLSFADAHQLHWTAWVYHHYWMPPMVSELTLEGDKPNRYGTFVRRGLETATRTENGPLLPLKVQGNRLVDSEGRAVLLRGVNLEDPYKLKHIDQLHDERIIERLVKEWNVNLIRVPIHPGLYREHSRYLEEVVDPLVDWTEERHVYILLGWHAIGNPLSGESEREDVIVDPALAFRALREMAQRYRDRPGVLFGTFNEPAYLESWSEWRGFATRLIDAVRAVHPQAVVTVSGLNWGYDLSGALKAPIARSNVIYESHPYPWKGDEWLRVLSTLAERHPVLLGEWGFDVDGWRPGG